MSEYYIIDRAELTIYPTIVETEDSEHTIEYIYDNQFNEIPEPKVMEFAMGRTISRNPVVGDYLSQPESVVSSKFQQVLETLNVKGVQMIPAKITAYTGDTYEDYFYIHIHKHIKAMDKEKSNFDVDDDDEDFYYINSFTLDSETLSNIPLEDRLVFKLEEDSGKNLYHKSVVEALMSINPVGVKFTKVDDWRL